MMRRCTPVLLAALVACSAPVASPPPPPPPPTSTVPAVADPAAAAAAFERVTHPGGASKLPSGRAGYRTYAEVGTDLGSLVTARPDIVKPVKLPFKSVLGAEVNGVEITHGVAAADGKPVFLLLGAHHAGEWPTADVSVEFAYDLAQQDARDPRVTALLDRVRVIVVPVVNPDGYDISRSGDVEAKRRNCAGFTTRAACVAAPDGGVDLNRNYGVNWGGVGSGSDTHADDFRGSAPFSEPETRNVRDLVSSRQVTVLVSLHTFAAMNLRPPGQRTTRDTPDEAVYAKLGEAMASANGYRSVRSRELYETSGSTSEWSYYTTGGLGFETELGGDDNHDPFQRAVIDQYLGTDPFLRADGGTRESLLRDAEAAGDRTLHAVVTGTAPAGAVLTLTKSFTAPTADPSVSFPSSLTSTMTAPGAFTWDVNPSVRPGRDGKVVPEDWTLRCTRPDGTLALEKPVRLARGEQVAVDCA
ncbi:M14 family zinc carboxypeptidase [Amycolatopsis sp. NPDC059657]|uniref:M14 family zinc carboxypeptidase n=1 Tax=Amycolatopsis sp. NPDC059657 TaxID=3346899 RepID=UPI00366CD8D9